MAAAKIMPLQTPIGAISSNPGRCDFLIAPGPTRRPFNKSYWADPVRLGNRTYRPGVLLVSYFPYIDANGAIRKSHLPAWEKSALPY